MVRDVWHLDESITTATRKNVPIFGMPRYRENQALMRRGQLLQWTSSSVPWIPQLHHEQPADESCVASRSCPSITQGEYRDLNRAAIERTRKLIGIDRTELHLAHRVGATLGGRERNVLRGVAKIPELDGAVGRAGQEIVASERTPAQAIDRALVIGQDLFCGRLAS